MQRLASLAFLLFWLASIAFGAEEAHVAFANNGLVDDISVSLSIGTPPRSYRLRVTFTPNADPRPGANLVLFNTHHHLHSSSYETIIDGELGIDTVDFSGNRWRAKVAYMPRPVSADVSAVEGLWVVSPFCYSIPSGVWSRFIVSRRGFQAGDSLETPQSRCSIPLQSTRPEPLTIGSMENITVLIDKVPVPGTYRVVVAPGNITTFLPTHLFQRYFEGRNVFSDDPTQWPSLVLAAENGCQIVWTGTTILPRSAVSPGGKSHSSEPFLQTIMREAIVADSEGELTRGHAMRGYNALKVHPHNRDNCTILVGGNVFWGSADLYIDQESGEARVIAHSPGRHITLADAFWLILLSISYIRWKFAGSWFDTCDRGDHFMAILSRISLLTSLSIFTSHLSGYLFYLPVGLPEWTIADSLVLYSGIVADGILFLIIGLYLREAFQGAIRDAVDLIVAFWHYVRGHPRPQSSALPVVPERLPCAKGRWDPRVMYARKHANRDFMWLPLHVFAFYTVLLDVAFAATAWITVSPFEDRLFADIMLILTFTVASYEVLYYALLSVTATLVRPHCVRHPSRSITVIATIAVAVLVVGFSGYFVIYRAIDDYSTMYEGTVLVFVTTFYMLVLLFVASRLAKENLHLALVPLAKK